MFRPDALPRRRVIQCFSLASTSAILGIRHLVGFAQPATPAGDAPLMVAVSTPVLADIVANVGGDRIAVWSVIPVGADPHTWEASAREMARLSGSDLFVYMGASLEPFIESGAWRRAAADSGIPTLVLSERIDLIKVDRVIDHGDHVHDLRSGDPHVWLDPLKTGELVAVVADELSRLDPAGREDYETRAVAYQAELRELDASLLALVACVPAARRKLVVFHDAFTYFAARYGFEVVGVVLNNPDAEPSAREIADLVAVINENDVQVIFKEPQFNADVLDIVAADTGVVIGELMTDTFAEGVASYLDLMRFNRDSLQRHLVGPGACLGLDIATPV